MAPGKATAQGGSSLRRLNLRAPLHGLKHGAHVLVPSLRNCASLTADNFLKVIKQRRPNESARLVQATRPPPADLVGQAEVMLLAA
jgi:hypothetical protein